MHPGNRDFPVCVGFHIFAMSMGRGAIVTGSQKQKLNTRSSTEAELVGVDDFNTKTLWAKPFLEEQGCEITKNVLCQDNKSAILLETNDQIEKGNLTVEHCPTEDMVADCMTKPLQGKQFDKI